MLQYVNAGHNPPIILRPQMESCELFHLRAQAVPIGMFVDTQFAATKFQLAKDDTLVAYTDGITEAANASGELWGWKDWSDCCGLVAGWRQMKSSSVSWPKCPSSQMASHSAMM